MKSKIQGHRILSEEDGVHNWDNFEFDGPVWVVDPLDGTVNFARNLPHTAFRWLLPLMA
uniref:inositol monophosphatase family protein n=1 Tax=Paenibacillus sp. FSL K6-1096 TaxID=2921460 RepID=UPI00403F86AC